MLINLFDLGAVAEHSALILRRAGHTVITHSPARRISESGRTIDNPQSLQYIGDDLENVDLIRSELTHALQKNRALWIISSAAASVVGCDMLDLCGNSGNIIFCAPPVYGENKILGSSLTVNRTKMAQQISKIRGKDNGKQYRELVACDDLIHTCRLALSCSEFRDNARIQFREATKGGAYLASSTLVAYAEYFNFPRPERPDYVQMVSDFIELRNN